MWRKDFQGDLLLLPCHLDHPPDARGSVSRQSVPSPTTVSCFIAQEHLLWITLKSPLGRTWNLPWLPDLGSPWSITEQCPLLKRNQIGIFRNCFLFLRVGTWSTDRNRFQRLCFWRKTPSSSSWLPTRRNCFAVGHHIPIGSQWEVHPRLLIAVPWFSEVTVSTWALYGKALGAPILSLLW